MIDDQVASHFCDVYYQDKAVFEAFVRDIERQEIKELVRKTFMDRYTDLYKEFTTKSKDKIDQINGFKPLDDLRILANNDQVA